MHEATVKSCPIQFIKNIYFNNTMAIQINSFNIPTRIAIRYGILKASDSDSEDQDTQPRSLLPCRLCKAEGRGIPYHTPLDCDYLSVAEKRELIDDRSEESSSDDESHYNRDKYYQHSSNDCKDIQYFMHQDEFSSEEEYQDEFHCEEEFVNHSTRPDYSKSHIYDGSTAEDEEYVFAAYRNVSSDKVHYAYFHNSKHNDEESDSMTDLPYCDVNNIQTNCKKRNVNKQDNNDNTHMDHEGQDVNDDIYTGYEEQDITVSYTRTVQKTLI